MDSKPPTGGAIAWIKSERFGAAGRLSGATWAPASITYGDNNSGTACLRAPYGRIELRLPNGAANPYLATAAIAAAGLDGIGNKIDAGEPLNINL
jgi:glutamine synthetase